MFSDHKNLEYFSSTRTTSRRHARWAATLAAYQYTIAYRKGASNGKPDALSRRPDYLPPPLPSLPILPLPPPSLPNPLPPGADPIFHSPTLRGAAVLVSPTDPFLHDVAAAQARDPVLSALINSLQRGPGGKSNPALPEGKPSGGSAEGQYTMHNGLLYSQGRLLIPSSASSLILRILQ